MLLPEKRIIPLTASSLTSLTTRPTDPPRGSTWFNIIGHFQMTNWATEHGLHMLASTLSTLTVGKSQECIQNVELL
jgi:hypothetical protein